MPWPVLCPGGVQTGLAASERNRLPEFLPSAEGATGTRDLPHQLPDAIAAALARGVGETSA